MSSLECFGMASITITKFSPFGLQSAPFLFNMLSDAVEWILVNKCYISFVCHIPDEFFNC